LARNTPEFHHIGVHATEKGQSACARPNGFFFKTSRFEGKHRFVIVICRDAKTSKRFSAMLSGPAASAAPAVGRSIARISSLVAAFPFEHGELLQLASNKPARQATATICGNLKHASVDCQVSKVNMYIKPPFQCFSM
jgi:hypothetical protein